MDSLFLYTMAQAAQLATSIPQLLSTTTLNASAASYTYTPTGSALSYPRLMCIWSATSTAAAATANLNLQFNGDTAAHYLYSYVQNNNATVTGNTGGNLVNTIVAGTLTAATSTASYWSSGSFTIDGANQSSHFATLVGNSAAYVTATSNYVGTFSGQYAAAGPITSVKLVPASGSLAAGSQFSFYGLS